MKKKRSDETAPTLRRDISYIWPRRANDWEKGFRKNESKLRKKSLATSQKCATARKATHHLPLRKVADMPTEARRRKGREKRRQWWMKPISGKPCSTVCFLFLWHRESSPHLFTLATVPLTLSNMWSYVTGGGTFSWSCSLLCYSLWKRLINFCFWSSVDLQYSSLPVLGERKFAPGRSGRLSNFRMRMRKCIALKLILFN